MSFSEMISSAPKKPGVYKMFDANGSLLYVGKAKDLSKRLRQYADAEKLEYPKVIMRRLVAHVEWITTDTEAAALILEQTLIKKERPKYNVILKDDKSYPFLALSKGEYPRLYRIRRKRADKKYGREYGPFPFVSDLGDTIKLVQKVCQIRTCADTVMAARKRPCILHQMGRCSAPCCIKGDGYAKQVKMARSILAGHIRIVASDLAGKMKSAAKDKDFEAAAKFLGQLQSLQSTVKTAMINKAKGGKK
ncbi:MAG: GIY-YIG nuclease family protein [Rickettsiales bacterium]|jgi:excinuclease ABC subunit C|nr:GIY-YIG nuclease family protein [Rickettsiales bacterium]